MELEQKLLCYWNINSMAFELALVYSLLKNI